MRVALKVFFVLFAVGFLGVLIRLFGFQILNSIVFTSSAPPPDLDKRLLQFFLVMSIVCLVILKDWIKK